MNVQMTPEAVADREAIVLPIALLHGAPTALAGWCQHPAVCAA
jgi:hypothetical protein